jgi:TonB family protein
MKKLPIVAGALLWCITATAGIFPATVPQDSTRTRMEIKRADLNKAGSVDVSPLKVQEKRADVNPDKTEIKAATTVEKPMVAVGKNSAEEMKNMAKRESRKSAEQSETPTVSYPYYPGGNIAIREFVRNTRRYPEECKRERLTGRVEVLIAIAPDGTPHSATISKSSGNVHMDAEALRVAELMPKWQPAAESDDPQGIDYVIYVNFRPGR